MHRRYARACGLINVKYKIPVLRIEGESSAKNISVKGICMGIDIESESVDLFKIGTPMELEIKLSNNPAPIFATGEVKWSAQVETLAGGIRFDVGIEFVKLEDSDKDETSKYVYDQSKYKTS